MFSGHEPFSSSSESLTVRWGRSRRANATQEYVRGGNRRASIDVVQAPHRREIGEHRVFAHAACQEHFCGDDRCDITTHGVLIGV
jgi:hypothetical protein